MTRKSFDYSSEMDTAHNIFTLLRLHHEIELDRNIENRRRSNQIQPHNIFAALTKVWRTTKPYSPWSLMTKTHRVAVKLPLRPPTFMVSTCSSHWREPFLENSNRPQTTMMKNNVLLNFKHALQRWNTITNKNLENWRSTTTSWGLMWDATKGTNTLLIRSTSAPRWITSLSDQQYPGWPQHLTRTSPWRTDNSMTPFCRSDHGGQLASRLEISRLVALWQNYWSRLTSKCVPYPN